MFRNPRETSTIDTGRPPTPPSTRSRTPKTQTNSPYFPTPTMAPSPVERSSETKKTPLKNGNSKTKPLARPNRSILNFFQKAPAGSQVNGDNTEELFFREKSAGNDETEQLSPRARSMSPSRMFLDGGIDLGRGDLFEDEENPTKRRKLESKSPTAVTPVQDACTPPLPAVDHVNQPNDAGQRSSSTARTPTTHDPTHKTVAKPKRRIGGFIDDSDSEDDGNEDQNDNTLGGSAADEVMDQDETPEMNSSTLQDNNKDSNLSHAQDDPIVIPDAGLPPGTGPPVLTRESTSMFDPGEFDEDFDEDEFYEQGEEYLERKYMQEQRELEMIQDEDIEDIDNDVAGPPPAIAREEGIAADCIEEASCPICSGSLAGASETEASQHVNSCLDGNPTPLPQKQAQPSNEEPVVKQEKAVVLPHKRFQRAAIARPAQENPFTFGSSGKGSSAFSALMSGHAEDAAWAVAAANEARSRGKPAWERTCPFYKILPGFFICVDGFRYGAVQGCNAYFLSHFHSDHYIGLTASWSHGPIYCSKVTANLVRQQLKVDPKWVRPLEWEETVEVPDTKGVLVTMIPANHCPGSSLYLFEKTIGKGANPRKQRVLHCGDFRACPAHVNHPLLMPDVVDKISGKSRQQVIDVCYLDTTYLTPKYAFPSQEDVIDSCAQMCVSLGKEILDVGDAWEHVKRERAGAGMVKFLGKEPKQEDVDENVKSEHDGDVEDIKPKMRGRLLVVIGTYSIGKERICLGIARAMKSKIYAIPSKQRICAALEDPELSSLLTSDPLEAQIHMQMVMEIRAETLAEYLASFRPHFDRVVGFRPTGWNYRPPTSRFTENPAVSTVLTSEGWKSRFTMKDLVPQRGSTKESNCFGVPYSEHSSFRELTMFCCALRIGKVIPTVNVGSKKSRERMKMWVEKWEAEKKKNGLFKVEADATSW